MSLYKIRQLAAFILCFFVRTVVDSIRKCGQDICRDDQVCCAQGANATTFTCCRQFTYNTYYNMAMVTRKLSGVLILLLLFALGYFVHRLLCSRTRQLVPPHNAHPASAVSQEHLMETRASADNLADQTPAARLPTYEECKRLPTYEETMRDEERSARTT